MDEDMLETKVATGSGVCMCAVLRKELEVRTKDQGAKKETKWNLLRNMTCRFA